jgi:NADH-quinone oxidoreductase subunit G
MAADLPAFSKVTQIAPPRGFRFMEMKVPRQPHRYSGRTAMHADISLHEPQSPDDSDSPLSFSMEGYDGQPPASLVTHYWAPGWNSVHALDKYQHEVGGPLKLGNPGIRLLEPLTVTSPKYFIHIAKPHARKTGEWLLVPLYHIFGSEELSLHSPAVAELAAQPYLALSSEDMKKLNVSVGDAVIIQCTDESVTLPVKRMDSLPEGIAGLPYGLPGTRRIDCPSSCRIVSSMKETKKKKS